MLFLMNGSRSTGVPRMLMCKGAPGSPPPCPPLLSCTEGRLWFSGNPESSFPEQLREGITRSVSSPKLSFLVLLLLFHSVTFRASFFPSLWLSMSKPWKAGWFPVQITNESNLAVLCLFLLSVPPPLPSCFPPFSPRSIFFF